MSYSSPDFKPFSSGCGMCKPSTDYYGQTQTGGGNYSEDGLIPQSNGKNFYKGTDYSMPLDNKFIKNNFGIDYATANGGAKKRKSKKSKKSMKGGVDMAETDDIKGLSSQDYALFSSGGSKKNRKSQKKSHKGGWEDDVPLPEETHKMDKQMNNILSTYSGGKKKSTRKSTKSAKKSKRSMSGGMESSQMTETEIIKHPNMPDPPETSEHHYDAIGGKKQKKSPKKSPKKSAKKSKKSMSGGMESSGATSLPTRFYNPQTPLDNYPELSGNGAMSAYGPIQSGDVGTGMLAPYTSSTCATANPSSGMKTGGSKKNRKTLKKSMSGGSDSVTGYSSQEYADYEASGGKKKTTRKSPKKGKKSMSGGMESSGATSLPTRFYNPQTPLDNYPELSGNGAMSAYGPIQSGDVGTGMLAPYTSSTCATANPSSGMKTGGSKKNKKTLKKSIKGGASYIPAISDSPVTSVQNGINGAIGKFTNFMTKLDNDYLKSVQYVKSIKIGNQRLIQGGSKHKTKKRSTKKPSTKKPSPKKPSPKKLTKKMSKKRGGSNGSDFALTLNSRGPVNAPDNYWGVPGEEWFRQFNKTGDYIPNSKLPYAATPLLAGTNKSGVVSGYDESMLAYPSV